jgi:hypothetical protein
VRWRCLGLARDHRASRRAGGKQSKSERPRGVERCCGGHHAYQHARDASEAAPSRPHPSPSSLPSASTATYIKIHFGTDKNTKIEVLFLCPSFALRLVPRAEERAADDEPSSGDGAANGHELAKVDRGAPCTFVLCGTASSQFTRGHLEARTRTARSEAVFAEREGVAHVVPARGERELRIGEDGTVFISTHLMFFWMSLKDRSKSQSQ